MHITALRVFRREFLVHLGGLVAFLLLWGGGFWGSFAWLYNNHSGPIALVSCILICSMLAIPCLILCLMRRDFLRLRAFYDRIPTPKWWQKLVYSPLLVLFREYALHIAFFSGLWHLLAWEHWPIENDYLTLGFILLAFFLVVGLRAYILIRREVALVPPGGLADPKANAKASRLSVAPTGAYPRQAPARSLPWAPDTDWATGCRGVHRHAPLQHPRFSTRH